MSEQTSRVETPDGTSLKRRPSPPKLAQALNRTVHSRFFVWAVVVSVGGVLAWFAFDEEAWAAELFAVAVLLVTLSFLFAGDSSRFQGLYVGTDGRWSTSKLQVLLWTLAIAFALASILIAALIGVPDAIDGLTDGAGSDDWDLYMILLGGPFAAAVAAKGLTAAKADSGDVAKPPEEPTGNLLEGMKEIVGNDFGDTDLIDFQYFLFNLLALVYFLGTFIPDVAAGLPSLPGVLVALTGTSAAGYVSKKAVEKQSPSITALLPARLRAGGKLDVTGRWLVVSDTTSAAPTVSIGAYLIDASDVTVLQARSSKGANDRLSIQLPQDLAQGETTLRLVTSLGGSAEQTVTVE